MGEARAGNMRLGVGATARFSIGEVVSAVDYNPARVGEMPRELGAGNESVQSWGDSSRRRNSWKCSMPSSNGDW